MQNDRQKLGKLGEESGCNYLEEHGYQILRKNYRCRLGEIDIVAKKGDQLVFVEVKTRRNHTYGRPGEAVNFRKQAKLTSVALWYLKEFGWKDASCRFDVLEILVQPDQTIAINHIDNAFQVATGKYYY